MKSSDVRDQLNSTLDDLQSSFEREIKEKQDAISTVQSHLQAATRILLLVERRLLLPRLNWLRRMRLDRECRTCEGRSRRNWDWKRLKWKVGRLRSLSKRRLSTLPLLLLLPTNDAMDVDASTEDIKPVLPSSPTGPEEAFITDLLSTSDDIETLVPPPLPQHLLHLLPHHPSLRPSLPSKSLPPKKSLNANKS